MGFDPATLAVASLATGALNAGVSAVGAAQQASATAASERYQAQVALNNQKVSTLLRPRLMARIRLRPNRSRPRRRSAPSERRWLRTALS
jgi:hypothetical protein